MNQVVLSENIFSKFSCNTWLLIPSELLPELIVFLELTMITPRYIWQNGFSSHIEDEQYNIDNCKLKNCNRIVVSPLLADKWYIIEGDYVSLFQKELGTNLSAKYGLYFFFTDLWLPQMTFSYYEEKICKRFYSYSLDHNGNEIIDESGVECLFEHLSLDTPTSIYGYDYFFYPLAVINYLDITYSEIDSALQKDCQIYKLPAPKIEKIIGLLENK